VSTDDPHLDTQALAANLLHQRTLARTQITRGIGLVIVVPIAFVAMLSLTLAFDSLWPIIVFCLYTIAGGTFGVASIVVGGARLRSAGKQLDEIQGEPIPRARLLT
jgi:hypothetical protein